MMAQQDLNELIRRTNRYEFEDGLRDIQFALLFFLVGAAVWIAFEPFWIIIVANAMRQFGRWAAWISLLPILAAPLAVWGMLRLMNYIRRTWLWRESGMVKSARWQVSRGANMTAALILVAGLGLGFGLRSLGWADDEFVLRMLWAATGWSTGYTLASVGHAIGLPRYVGLGAAGGLLSTALLFLSLPFGQTALALGLLWAGLLATSGALALRRASQALTKRH